MSEDRCRGHCCRGFALLSPEDVQRKVGEARLRKEAGTADPHDEELLEVVAPMLIHLGKFEENPAGATREGALRPGYPPDHFWSCRHLLPNNDCAIYETRPYMCRNYPNGHPCSFVLCASTTMKNYGAVSCTASGGAPFVPLERVEESAKRSLCVLVGPMQD